MRIIGGMSQMKTLPTKIQLCFQMEEIMMQKMRRESELLM